MITTLNELGISENVILIKRKEKFHLEEELAKTYFDNIVKLGYNKLDRIPEAM